MVSFDTNILVYATAPQAPEKGRCARTLVTRGLRSTSTVLLLQTLGEFSHVALRKEGMPVDAVLRLIEAWRGLLPVYAAEESDLIPALKAVRDHDLSFWDAVLWASARRLGVRHLLTEDLQDGRNLDGVRFVNPFSPANEALIDRLLLA
jgi:predicted nucleic acid-binding protein